MGSLKERLEAIARGEIQEEGGDPSLPAFDDQEMSKCTSALSSLVRIATSTTSARAPLRPPSEAIHLIL